MKKIIGITFLVISAALYSCNNEKVDTVTFDEQLSEKSSVSLLKLGFIIFN